MPLLKLFAVSVDMFSHLESGANPSHPYSRFSEMSYLCTPLYERSEERFQDHGYVLAPLDDLVVEKVA